MTSQPHPFLKRENLIRYAGCFLIASPIGNFIIGASFSGILHWWYPHVCLSILKNISLLSWLLWISAIVVGAMMLKGRRSSWIFTLFILGLNILVCLFYFKEESQSGWLKPSASLLVDLVLFALIYSQEFHQRLERKLTLAKWNRALNAIAKKELVIRFDGFGDWAKIVGLDPQILIARPLTEEIPVQITTRIVEISLDKTFSVRAQFLQMHGNDYVFQFRHPNEGSIEQLSLWATRSIKPSQNIQDSSAA